MLFIRSNEAHTTDKSRSRGLIIRYCKSLVFYFISISYDTHINTLKLTYTCKRHIIIICISKLKMANIKSIATSTSYIWHIAKIVSSKNGGKVSSMLFIRSNEAHTTDKSRSRWPISRGARFSCVSFTGLIVSTSLMAIIGVYNLTENMFYNV